MLQMQEVQLSREKVLLPLLGPAQGLVPGLPQTAPLPVPFQHQFHGKPGAGRRDGRARLQEDDLSPSWPTQTPFPGGEQTPHGSQQLPGILGFGQGWEKTGFCRAEERGGGGIHGEHQNRVEPLLPVPAQATGWEHCPREDCSPGGLLQVCQDAEEEEIALPRVQEGDQDGHQDLHRVGRLSVPKATPKSGFLHSNPHFSVCREEMEGVIRIFLK